MKLPRPVVQLIGDYLPDSDAAAVFRYFDFLDYSQLKSRIRQTMKNKQILYISDISVLFYLPLPCIKSSLGQLYADLKFTSPFSDLENFLKQELPMAWDLEIETKTISVSSTWIETWLETWSKEQKRKGDSKGDVNFLPTNTSLLLHSLLKYHHLEPARIVLDGCCILPRDRLLFERAILLGDKSLAKKLLFKLELNTYLTFEFQFSMSMCLEEHRFKIFEICLDHCRKLMAQGGRYEQGRVPKRCFRWRRTWRRALRTGNAAVVQYLLSNQRKLGRIQITNKHLTKARPELRPLLFRYFNKETRKNFKERDRQDR
jgi:hypothetical protein